MSTFLFDIVRCQKAILCYLFFFIINISYAQQGFTLKNGKKRDKIKFELVNNLVVIPVEVNGTKLSFLLDTGVNATIIFSVAQADTLQIKQATPIKIRGLGPDGSIDAIRSTGNTVKIGNAIDRNHSLYFVYDESLNFSPRMGVPIHGIIGYDYFRKFIVKTNYTSKTVTAFDPASYKQKICNKCEVFDIIFNQNKPFIALNALINGEKKEQLLLLDSGSSDALWFFNDYGFIDPTSKNYFDDFLGLGLSGNIFGKRSKLQKVSIGNFEFKEISVAFPEFKAIKEALEFKERTGSLGGSFLKRFTTIVDYTNRKLVLKKNNTFSAPFYYNMAGITLEHTGMEYVKRKAQSPSLIIRDNQSNSASTSNTISTVSRYEILLVPKYQVVSVREGSPAHINGMEKGDEIISVNGKPAYNWKLYELNNLFSSKEGRKIYFKILDKNGVEKRIKIKLKKVL